MLPLPNRPAPTKPPRNIRAAITSVLRTPMAFSICDPMTAPMQKATIMMLKVSPTASFSSPKEVLMGVANMENA